MDRDRVEWLGLHLVPFEAQLRLRLRKVCDSPAEVDDVVQEVYCKVIQMASVAHIAEPHAFLVRMAKNIVTDRFRREAVVSIEAMANLEELAVADEAPGPERIALGRLELKWVAGIIARLPARSQHVFRARRLYGLSQKETAESMNLTEKVVEYETTKAMELISGMIAHSSAYGDPAPIGKASKNKQAKKNNVSDR